MTAQTSILTTKYLPTICLISAAVAIMIHFPELVSLLDQHKHYTLFPGIDIEDVASEVVFTFISLLILFALNTFIFRFNRPSDKITWWQVSLSLFITWILSSMLGKFFVFFHHTFDIPAINITLHQYLHPLRDFIITCVVSGSCYIIHLMRQKQLIFLENQQLRTDSLLNQYEALKNQLNPHMLFNSLNTLRSLVRESPDRAQDYIQELSKVLRYTLQVNESRSVTLKEEMEFVEAYMFLLQMRYEDNLYFETEIKESCNACHIAPMSVQLLIENAVKHNEISSRKPLTISIVSSDDNNLVISNRIQPKITISSGLGIGLANLKKRYRLLFRKDIEVYEESGTFRVVIPLISPVV